MLIPISMKIRILVLKLSVGGQAHGCTHNDIIHLFFLAKSGKEVQNELG
jgi:hypothetical protein